MTAETVAPAAPGVLYLVPMPLGDLGPSLALPPATAAIAARLRYFIAENARTARRLLAQLPLAIPIQQIAFAELNEHTPAEDIEPLLTPILAGEDGGVVSEAGCPAIADPGSALVALAHRRGVRVVPLVGPNALMLALMASGMNGQSFRFHGYLPTDAAARAARITAIETDSARDGTAHLFIETPYRGAALLAALLAHCRRPNTRVAVAADLTLPTESIVVHSLAGWRTASPPPLDKRPAVFLLQAERAVSARESKPRRSS